MNRLVKVTRKSDSVVIGVHAWDAQSRRVLHTVTDGSNNENLRFFYKEGQLIEETDSEGSLVGQSVFGGMGERIESQAGFLSNRYLFEKLDGSIVSYADINKVVKAYYDYKTQGLVQLVTPLNQRYFTFGLFYASVNLSNSRHYLWQGVRIDFETGHYYGTAGTRMYDPVNGRKTQPSNDMWIYSNWGLRYNSNPCPFAKGKLNKLITAIAANTNLGAWRLWWQRGDPDGIMFSAGVSATVAGGIAGSYERMSSVFYNCCRGSVDDFSSSGYGLGFGRDFSAGPRIDFKLVWFKGGLCHPKRLTGFGLAVTAEGSVTPGLIPLGIDLGGTPLELSRGTSNNAEMAGNHAGVSGSLPGTGGSLTLSKTATSGGTSRCMTKPEYDFFCKGGIKVKSPTNNPNAGFGEKKAKTSRPDKPSKSSCVGCRKKARTKCSGCR